MKRAVLVCGAALLAFDGAAAFSGAPLIARSVMRPAASGCKLIVEFLEIALVIVAIVKRMGHKICV